MVAGGLWVSRLGPVRETGLNLGGGGNHRVMGARLDPSDPSRLFLCSPQLSCAAASHTSTCGSARMLAQALGTAEPAGAQFCSPGWHRLGDSPLRVQLHCLQTGLAQPGSWHFHASNSLGFGERAFILGSGSPEGRSLWPGTITQTESSSAWGPGGRASPRRWGPRVHVPHMLGPGL